MTTTVANKYKLPLGWEKDPRYVYIGRPGPWGNPYIMQGEDTRDEVIALFKKDFDHAVLFPEGQWGHKSVETLRDKVLVCFCAPKPCHGDVIASYLNTGKIGVPLSVLKTRIVCGTGHRPNKLGGYDENTFHKLVELCEFALTYPDIKPDIVVTGGALGFDQALAYACLQLGVPYDVYVPCEGHSSMWPLPAQQRYEEILSGAREVKLVTPGPYQAWKMQRRNEAMVDVSDAVVALWDGTSGGTGNCITYARKKNKTIYHLWKRWSEMK